MSYQQHGDGVYAVCLFPKEGKDWSWVGFVSVKNLDDAGAPDCDTGEWLLSAQAMKELGLEAKLPLPQEASVRLDFLEAEKPDRLRSAIMADFIRSDDGEPLRREDFKKFRVVSFRTSL